jgi:hypothetical protein
MTPITIELAQRGTALAFEVVEARSGNAVRRVGSALGVNAQIAAGSAPNLSMGVGRSLLTSKKFASLLRRLYLAGSSTFVSHERSYGLVVSRHEATNDKSFQSAGNWTEPVNKAPVGRAPPGDQASIPNNEEADSGKRTPEAR